jgi:membrane protein DedA with SNARE-associated domain
MDILGPILSYLLLYRYAALFVIIYGASIIVPLPVNAMLLALGAFASHGYFNIWLSLGIATAANVLGDLTDYVIVYIWGEIIIRKLHLHKLKFFNQLAEELRTDATLTVFTTRFAGSLSTIGNFLSGLVKVPFKIFFLCDLIANFFEIGIMLAVGYIVGDYWSDLSNVSTTVGGVIAAGIALFVLIRIHQRMKKKYEK